MALEIAIEGKAGIGSFDENSSVTGRVTSIDFNLLPSNPEVTLTLVGWS